MGSQYHEHLGEWVGSTRLRSLYRNTFLYLYIWTYLHIYTDKCSIYISLKVPVLQKLALKKFYINMSQCLANFGGLQALRETAISPHQKVGFVPPNLPKVPWISVPSIQRRTWDGGGASSSTAHLHLFASISILIRLLRIARQGCLTKSTRCLPSGQAGENV